MSLRALIKNASYVSTARPSSDDLYGSIISFVHIALPTNSALPFSLHSALHPPFLDYYCLFLLDTVDVSGLSDLSNPRGRSRKPPCCPAQPSRASVFRVWPRGVLMIPRGTSGARIMLRSAKNRERYSDSSHLASPIAFCFQHGHPRPAHAPVPHPSSACRQPWTAPQPIRRTDPHHALLSPWE